MLWGIVNINTISRKISEKHLSYKTNQHVVGLHSTPALPFNHIGSAPFSHEFYDSLTSNTRHTSRHIIAAQQGCHGHQFFSAQLQLGLNVWHTVDFHMRVLRKQHRDTAFAKLYSSTSANNSILACVQHIFFLNFALTSATKQLTSEKADVST